jgi:uncharacterized LabA/DUF88 family protein
MSQRDPGKIQRHETCLKCLESTGVKVILGRFKEKDTYCPNCRSLFLKHEEKETDVHIAVQMIRDVVLDQCDISVLVSADSDLIPPIEFINELKPAHKIFVYFPPARFSYDLKQRATNFLSLNNHEIKFKDSQFPDEVTLKNGYVLKRPESWK